jgi:hypothetical protein
VERIEKSKFLLSISSYRTINLRAAYLSLGMATYKLSFVFQNGNLSNPSSCGLVISCLMSGLKPERWDSNRGPGEEREATTVTGAKGHLTTFISAKLL